MTTERSIVCKWHQEEIENLKKCVFGNGREGIEPRMARMETKLNIMIALMIPIIAAIVTVVIQHFAS